MIDLQWEASKLLYGRCATLVVLEHIRHGRGVHLLRVARRAGKKLQQRLDNEHSQQYTVDKEDNMGYVADTA